MQHVRSASRPAPPPGRRDTPTRLPPVPPYCLVSSFLVWSPCSSPFLLALACIRPLVHCGHILPATHCPLTSCRPCTPIQPCEKASVVCSLIRSLCVHAGDGRRRQPHQGVGLVGPAASQCDVTGSSSGRYRLLTISYRKRADQSITSAHPPSPPSPSLPPGRRATCYAPTSKRTPRPCSP